MRLCQKRNIRRDRGNGFKKTQAYSVCGDRNTPGSIMFSRFIFAKPAPRVMHHASVRMKLTLHYVEPQEGWYGEMKAALDSVRTAVSKARPTAPTESERGK